MRISNLPIGVKFIRISVRKGSCNETIVGSLHEYGSVKGPLISSVFSMRLFSVEFVTVKMCKVDFLSSSLHNARMLICKNDFL